MIRLRRPAVLHVADAPWQPDAHLCEAAEARWALLRKANDRLFDGELLHVTGVHRNGHGGAVIHAAPCAYRWYAVQADGPDTGCRPLSVQGFVRRGDEVLVGRRATWTTFHGDMWEFAPSGGVQPGQTPEVAIAAELTEETSLQPAGAPRALGVFLDDTALSWTLLLDISVQPGEARCPADEYQTLQWVAVDAVPGRLTPAAEAMRRLMLPRGD